MKFYPDHHIFAVIFSRNSLIDVTFLQLLLLVNFTDETVPGGKHEIR